MSHKELNLAKLKICAILHFKFQFQSNSSIALGFEWRGTVSIENAFMHHAVCKPSQQQRG